MKPQTISKLGLNQATFVAALRSGKYVQCTSKLHDGTAFCALGLAAHITGADWIEGERFGHKLFGLEDSDGTTLFAILPISYERLYALKPNGRWLHELNDCGQTFAQIADAIEADPGKFFTEAR